MSEAIAFYTPEDYAATVAAQQELAAPSPDTTEASGPQAEMLVLSPEEAEQLTADFEEIAANLEDLLTPEEREALNEQPQFKVQGAFEPGYSKP